MSIEDQVANLTYLYLRYDCNLQLKYHTNYLERMTLVINYLHRAFKRLATRVWCTLPGFESHFDNGTMYKKEIKQKKGFKHGRST